jgi:hypothetical protein
MARPHAAVSTTGAFVYHSTDHRQYVRRESHPRDHFGRVACCCYTTDASRTSGSGGNRTHVNLFKRQAPRQRRTHFRFQPAIPRGLEPPIFSVTGRRPLQLAHGTVFQQVAEESNPAGLSRRFWRPSAFPDAVATCISSPSPTVPRAGVEPDLSGLKDHRPHRKSNGAYRRTTLSNRPRQRAGSKSEPAGGRFLPPAGAVAITGSPGVIRSYPVPRFPYPDPNRDPSQADP